MTTALISLAQRLPDGLLKSLTWDRGKEMAKAHKLYAGDRCCGLLLRSAEPVAAWLERERHRSSAAILPEGHQSKRSYAGAVGRDRETPQFGTLRLCDRTRRAAGRPATSFRLRPPGPASRSQRESAVHRSRGKCLRGGQQLLHHRVCLGGKFDHADWRDGHDPVDRASNGTFRAIAKMMDEGERKHGIAARAIGKATPLRLVPALRRTGVRCVEPQWKKVGRLLVAERRRRVPALRSRNRTRPTYVAPRRWPSPNNRRCCSRDRTEDGRRTASTIFRNERVLGCRLFGADSCCRRRNRSQTVSRPGSDSSGDKRPAAP